MKLFFLDLHVWARMQVDRVFGSCAHVMICNLRSVQQSVCLCYSALARWGLTVCIFLSVRFYSLPLASFSGSWCCATCCAWNPCSTRIYAAYSLCFPRCGLRHWSLDAFIFAARRDGVAECLRKTLVVYLIAQSIRFFFSFLFIFLVLPSPPFLLLLFSFHFQFYFFLIDSEIHSCFDCTAIEEDQWTKQTMIILGCTDSVPQKEIIRRSDTVQAALEKENHRHQDSQLSFHFRV